MQISVKRTLMWAAVSVAMATPSLGQSLRVHRQEGPSSSSAHYDGQQVRIESVVSNGTATSRQTFTAAVGDLNFTTSAVKVNEEGVPYIEFGCKYDRSCWDTHDSGWGATNPTSMAVVACASRQECQDFLSHLKSAYCNGLAATYRPSTDRPTLPGECQGALERATTYRQGQTPPRATAPAEPVIDGSTIPSRIDFPESTRIVPTAPVVAPPVTPVAPPPTATPVAPAVTPVPARPRGVSASPANVESYAPLFHVPSLPINKVEELGAGLFEESVRSALRSEGRVSPTRYVAKELVQDQVKALLREGAALVSAGRSWRELPEALRRDAAVSEAALERIFDPGLKTGVALVNSLGELFDLVN
jgi:hypothetical protein